MSEQRRPEPGDWVQIYDDDREAGEVVSVSNEAVVYYDHRRHCEYRVPPSIVILVDHPDIDAAAMDIVDILREYDPSWGQNPTLELRRRIVRAVMRRVRPGHEGLTRPEVTA